MSIILVLVITVVIIPSGAVAATADKTVTNSSDITENSYSTSNSSGVKIDNIANDGI